MKTIPAIAKIHERYFSYAVYGDGHLIVAGIQYLSIEINEQDFTTLN